MSSYLADIEVQADNWTAEQEMQMEIDYERWREENAVWPIDPVDLCGFCNKEIEDDRKRGYQTVCRKCNYEYHLSEYQAGLL